MAGGEGEEGDGGWVGNRMVAGGDVDLWGGVQYLIPYQIGHQIRLFGNGWDVTDVLLVYI